MASFHIPELSDLADTAALEAALRTADAQVRDCWILWATLEIAKVLRRFPAIGSLWILNTRPSLDRIDFDPKVADPANWSGVEFYSALYPWQNKEQWSWDEIAELKKAEEIFAAWANDERFASFMRQRRTFEPKECWFRLADTAVERGLLAAIGRPDLWPRIEAGILAKHAKAPDAVRGAQRI